MEFNDVIVEIGKNIIINGISGWIEHGTNIIKFTKKRRDVGFGFINSLSGGIDEANRKLKADFEGKEFVEDRKCIDFFE